MDSYRQVRNKVNVLNIQQKKHYYTNKISACQGNMKGSWKAINELLNKRSKYGNIYLKRTRQVLADGGTSGASPVGQLTCLLLRLSLWRFISHTVHQDHSCHWKNHLLILDVVGNAIPSFPPLARGFCKKKTSQRNWRNCTWCEKIIGGYHQNFSTWSDGV